MSTFREYYAESVGHVAYAVISRSQMATVVGVTSRGLFVRSSERWVLFLSREDLRGPLTITVGAVIEQLQRVPIGSVAVLGGGALTLPPVDSVISADDDSVWISVPQSHHRSRVSARLGRMRSLVSRALEQRRSGLIRSLPSLLQPERVASRSRGREGITSRILSLHTALQARDIERVAEITSQSLGAGRGLTPAWDDLVLGLLLVLNRWRRVVKPGSGMEWLSRFLVQSAYERTTTVSANLIECATLGHACEALANVVDYVFRGEMEERACLEAMLGWGGSSGTDFLVGVVLGVLSSSRPPSQGIGAGSDVETAGNAGRKYREVSESAHLCHQPKHFR